MTAIDARTQVLLIDDDEHLRQALAQTLDLAGLRVEILADARGVAERISSDWPGVVVSDIRMPGIDGLQLLAQLHQQDADLPVLLITGHGDVPLAVRALKRGAADFIEKPHEEERLVLAVANALHADTAQRREAHRLAPGNDGTAGDLNTRLATLSDREREVMDRMLTGKPTRQIAEELCISVKTIEFHRARIREKLGAVSQAHLLSLFISAEGMPPSGG